MRLYTWRRTGLADEVRSDAIPDAAGGEGGHGAAKPDGVIHRYLIYRFKNAFYGIRPFGPVGDRCGVNSGPLSTNNKQALRRPNLVLQCKYGRWPCTISRILVVPRADFSIQRLSAGNVG